MRLRSIPRSNKARYDHDAVLKDGVATIRFPLPGRRGENMVTRSRQADTGLSWNGSHLFSLITLDIRASMPGRIAEVTSTSHSISAVISSNKAKIDIESHVTRVSIRTADLTDPVGRRRFRTDH